MSKLHKILCVEDDPDIRMILDLALSKLGGFQICLAEDASEALKQLDGFKPDLLLLDLMLPGMTGLELFNRIRVREEYASLPAILLTAKLCQETPAEYKQPGLLGVIAKPFDPMMLASRIERLYCGKT
jgi:two-component system OmpR family response regulator